MKSRTGSALLVVLGMMAFMVISGLAFAIFMRSTRMTSSFTRRTSATRQLAKAALAEAIDQVDRAIANDPHPNVRQGNSNEKNYWLGRVLMTTDTTSGTEKKPSQVVSEINSNPKEGGCKESVPVLSLEALAYLPPCLVNEARYYGQRTASASWQNLSFDAGRYAFIALDVSDYFDVHRLLAAEARLSTPASRVTYGYAFENGEHSQWNGGADAWDSFFDQFRTVNDDGTLSYGANLPLVSLADFNLAYGAQDSGGVRNPFVRYMESPGSKFYGANPGSTEFEKYGAMTFVTDSLEAPIPEDEKKTAKGETILDLDGEAGQVFAEAFLSQPQEDRSLLSIGQLNAGIFKRWVQKRVPYVTMFALSDYLDRDRIPITLAMPSVERVPMICGIKPAIGGTTKLKVTTVKNPDNNGADKEISGSMASKSPVVKMQRNVRWRIDAASLGAGFLGGVLQTLVVYPFRNHEQQSESGWFRLDGKIQLFLSSEVMRLRTGESGDLLHWQASGSATSPGNAQLVESAVVNLPIQAQDIPLKTVVTDPKDCVLQVNLVLSDAASAIADALEGEKGDILDVTYEWERTLDPDTGVYDNDYASSLPPESQITAVSSRYHPLKADGTVDSAFTQLSKTSVASLDKTLYLNFIPTLRVISSNAKVLTGSSGTKTVDMVPASLYDDDLNGVENGNGLAGAVYSSIGGQPTPLMKFETGASFNLKLDLGATCDAQVQLTPSAVMVDDPRYNHAPENWKELADFSAQGWYTAQSSGANDRDGDIFMAASDQSYLQSVYELAFLPRASDLESYSDAIKGNLGSYDGASWIALGKNASGNAVNPPDADVMWKTYDIFGRYSSDGDDFEGLGLENFGRGLRVNPYSDATNVMMAAFANTPYDWRLASDNETDNPAANTVSDASAFNKQFAWNEYSRGAKISWDALSAVAGNFMSSVRTRAVNGSGDWRDALIDIFDQNAARDTSEYLCGVDLVEYPGGSGENSPVYSVDKKFLFGFWRTCFAARQQLFLIFFRSEPTMLGGGIAGVTPPQLGAKGVAVVWRNPYRTTGAQNNNNNNSSGYVPHQTRILFYRQFE